MNNTKLMQTLDTIDSYMSKLFITDRKVYDDYYALYKEMYAEGITKSFTLKAESLEKTLKRTLQIIKK